jgi:hypothetical protein
MSRALLLLLNRLFLIAYIFGNGRCPHQIIIIAAFVGCTKQVSNACWQAFNNSLVYLKNHYRTTKPITLKLLKYYPL